MSSQELKVYGRVKPLSSGFKSDEVEVTEEEGGKARLRARNALFMLDGAFDDRHKQQDVYDKVAAEPVEGLLSGYSAAILAYGQTGSGKTHTLYGPDNVLSASSVMRYRSEWGIVPRVCEHLFRLLDEHAKKHGSTSRVTITYVEIYNNTLNCLLSGGKDLKAYEGKKGGVNVEGLEYFHVNSADEAIETIWKGSEKRVVAAMAMNARSSRGHSIVSLHVETTSKMGGVRTGKLSMVDLAGMESSKKSSAVGVSDNAARKEEAKNINTSLVALATVIDKMASSGKGHVPWRDSKLTRLLQDTLTGGGKSSIVVTVRQEGENIEEGVNTLRFAAKAATVQVTVNRNLQKISAEQADRLLTDLETTVEDLEQAREEIQRLKASLKAGGVREVIKIKEVKSVLLDYSPVLYAIGTGLVLLIIIALLMNKRLAILTAVMGNRDDAEGFLIKWGLATVEQVAEEYEDPDVLPENAPEAEVAERYLAERRASGLMPYAVGDEVYFQRANGGESIGVITDIDAGGGRLKGNAIKYSVEFEEEAEDGTQKTRKKPLREQHLRPGPTPLERFSKSTREKSTANKMRSLSRNTKTDLV